MNLEQQRHILASVDRDEEMITRMRPIAIEQIFELIMTMEQDTVFEDKWSLHTLVLWAEVLPTVEYAIHGRPEGWFDTPFPHPVDMLKELFRD